jgi:hypothetical protein
VGAAGTLSLARLRYDQGRPAQWRDLLVPAYPWFTKGFDTPGFEAAAALLGQLSAHSARF